MNPYVNTQSEPMGTDGQTDKRTKGRTDKYLLIYSGISSHSLRGVCIVLEAAQIWRELALHYFPTDCFGGSSNLEGTGSTLFSGGLFCKFGGNWLHNIFQWIVLEAAQIWQELAPHFFLADCFGGSSELAGTGSTLFSSGLIWKQLKFGEN